MIKLPKKEQKVKRIVNTVQPTVVLAFISFFSINFIKEYQILNSMEIVSFFVPKKERGILYGTSKITT
jgi:hypothetical protein